MKSCSSPKVEMRQSVVHGKGLFAKESISAGEIVVNFDGGRGQFITLVEADSLYDRGNDHMIQVGENLFFAAVSDSDMETEDLINHSCNPNCGIHGSLCIVAMRNIAVNEEITFDYAMSESSQYHVVCKCGNNNCRKIITGDDWKIKKLQNKYRGFFSDYLQQKIDSLNRNLQTHEEKTKTNKESVSVDS